MNIKNNEYPYHKIAILLFLIVLVLVCVTIPTTINYAAMFDRSHVVHWTDDRGPKTWPNFPNPPLGCTNCHYDDTPHHGSPYLFADTKDFAETTVCDSCHSKVGAFDGVAMAKANWDSGVYIGTDYENLQTGKEQWCTTCHDDAPPTINGITAKNVSGNNIAYGYFISGHGKYDIYCTDCHDPTLNHIDSYDRTYSAASDNYTQGYRLKLIDGNSPMEIPRGSYYNSSQFRLCYSCHDENALFDIIPPIITDFADLYLWDTENNLHRYHITGNAGLNPFWDSDLSGETGHTMDSAISCPACHNPHGKDYDGRSTFSMTRQDMGLIHKRDVRGLYGSLESGNWGSPGGDLNCNNECHPHNLVFKYYYQLGTPPPENPGFWTKLNSQTDVTNPTYGNGGTFLGGTFTSYDRYGVTETGLSITSNNQGCRFPASNINSYDEFEGETIDFWFVPNFDFSSNSTNRLLFEYYDPADPDNFIQIGAVPIIGNDSGLEFRIGENIGATEIHRLVAFPLPWTWGPGSAHHIVCTWGPAQGMHMYLDGVEPSYSINDGLNYYGGTNTNQTSYFYVGRRQDGTLPATGIIDDLKIYGYQYQKFEYGFSLFSKMGSLNDIQNPIKGSGGVTGGTVSYVAGQQGNGTVFSSSSIGVVGFPTTNLNPLGDTIDLWYKPYFHIEDNTASNKYLFLHYIDNSNYAFIKVDMNALNFTITENGNSHILKTIGLKNWDWYHIVCTWGSKGMHIYIDDKEVSYSDNSGLSYIGGLPTTTPMPTYFGIGNTSGTADNYCDGIIDELRVYGYQGSPSYLEFLVECPVDIQVIDPLGRIVDKFQNEIRGAKYFEQDFNGDSSLDDKIIIPNPRHGNYIVLIIPEPGADPSDVYTLKVINGGTPLVITQNAPIGDIDGEETFGITFTSEGVKLAKLLSPQNHAILSDPVTFEWESIGYDGFRIEFSLNGNFSKHKVKLEIPNKRGWISGTQYTPIEREWNRIVKIARRNRAIYWRVIATDAEGNIGSSEVRSFTISPSQKK